MGADLRKLDGLLGGFSSARRQSELDRALTGSGEVLLIGHACAGSIARSP